MSDKKSFIFYYDKREMLEELLKTDSESSVSYERVGRLFMALFDFAEYGQSNIELDFATKIAYKSIVPQIQSDKEKYKAIVERNRANGVKGGRPLKNPNGYYENPKNPSGYLENPKNPSKPDTVTDTVTDTDKNIVCERLGEQRELTTPRTPTLEEVKQYCKSKNYDFAEKFFYYYQSVKWLDKNNTPIDWKAKADYWKVSDDEKKPPQKRYGDFDAEDAFKAALNRTYAKTL